MMTPEEALEYIHSRSWKGSVLGLSRISELMEKLGDPQKNMKFVHVAGTNGKGSTAVMTASVLRAAGYRTGLFTSPYIQSFNERIRVDGENIPDEALARITELVRPVAEQMEDIPTEFELVTAIGLMYFAQTKCDIVVLEVGLGGELDSTNVIDSPEVAVLCSIGLDHTEILGNSLTEIAMAKAGIIKPGCTVVAYRGEREVEDVFRTVCRDRGATLRWADFDSIIPGAHSLHGQRFSWNGFRSLQIRLLGAHQLKNAVMAMETALALREGGWNIPDAAIRQGLEEAAWPARFEVLSEDPLFILDGGHNPQCIAALVQNITDYIPDRRKVFLIGLLADKDYPQMMEACAPLADRFVTVTPDSPRALSAEGLAAFLVQYGKPVTACSSIQDGVAEALRQAADGAVVCAFGSLYMSGKIRACFGKN